MFSTLHTSARAVLLTALVGGAALVAPTVAAAQSVTPERALLNLQAAPSEALIAVTQGHARPALVEPAVLHGERALLNHSQTTAEAPVDAIVRGKSVVGDAQYPTGVKALLNRSSL